MMRAMDLAAIAAELYMLPPGGFTAARNDRSKAAKAEGQSLLAKQVSRLPKPSVAAWSVDALAHRRPEALARVLELGAALRDAQDALDPDRMRELGQRRTRVVGEAVQSARHAAGELGVTVSEAAAAEIEQTLRAAMADPLAAEAARSGLLVRSLVSTGLEPVDLEGAVAVPGAVSEPAAPRGGERGASRPAGSAGRSGGPAKESGHTRAEDARRRDAEAARRKERDEAAADLADAQRRRDEADAELADAQGQATAASGRRDRLAEEVEDLRRRTAVLEQELEAAEREASLAERARRLAARVAEQEGRAVERARERLDRLH